MPLLAYRLITTLVSPLLAAVMLLRGDGWQQVCQRLGFVPPQRAKTLWFHAASVGEFRALHPLICRDWGRPVVLTVQSRQGLDTARQELPSGIVILPAPLDAPGWFGRFLARIQPDALVLVESELWPGWMQALQAAGVPAVLLDGALSARSARRWARWPQLVRPVTRTVRRVTVSSEQRREVFERLGFAPIDFALPLKLAGEPLAVDAGLVSQWREWLAGTELVTLANVHRSELAVLQTILKTLAPGVKFIVAPRYPEQLSAIQTVLGEANDTLAYWSGFGTLGSLYALGGTVIMGGGFDAEIGSHNPLEALRAGCAVVCGPEAGKQAELIALLEQRGMLSRTPDWLPPRGNAPALRALAEEARDQAIGAIEAVLKPQG